MVIVLCLCVGASSANRSRCFGPGHQPPFATMDSVYSILDTFSSAQLTQFFSKLLDPADDHTFVFNFTVMSLVVSLKHSLC